MLVHLKELHHNSPVLARFLAKAAMANGGDELSPSQRELLSALLHRAQAAFEVRLSTEFARRWCLPESELRYIVSDTRFNVLPVVSLFLCRFHSNGFIYC